MSDHDRSVTFDFGEGPMVESSVVDVQSTADAVIVARGGTWHSVIANVRHRGAQPPAWSLVVAVATVVGAVAAVVELFL